MVSRDLLRVVIGEVRPGTLKGQAARVAPIIVERAASSVQAPSSDTENVPSPRDDLI